MIPFLGKNIMSKRLRNKKKSKRYVIFESDEYELCENIKLIGQL